MKEISGTTSSMKIRVTVCQMNEDRERFDEDWRSLAAHVKEKKSDLVLLPEMPFSTWFPRKRSFDRNIWEEAVKDHDHWIRHLSELSPAAVLGSRPVSAGKTRSNQGFIWDVGQGYKAIHTKHYLPDEEGFWEASWYSPAKKEFVPAEIRGIRTGFLICTDLWFFQHARDYGKQGAHILACPRATPRATLDKWLAGGKTASVVSGAFTISSNRCEDEISASFMGGQGWIVDPEGEVLGLTSSEDPFRTLEIDLNLAEKAKSTYPRYVKD